MINEDGVATNSIGSGQVAGAGWPIDTNQAEPGVPKNEKKKLRKLRDIVPLPLFKRKP